MGCTHAEGQSLFSCLCLPPAYWGFLGTVFYISSAGWQFSLETTRKPLHLNQLTWKHTKKPIPGLFLFMQIDTHVSVSTNAHTCTPIHLALSQQCKCLMFLCRMNSLAQAAVQS